MLKISVITVCRNAAATLPATLDSVARQHCEGFELEHLVIDGASTDGSEKFATISEPDEGIYDAMNKGIRRATGDVIGFLNADDRFADEAVLGRIAAAFTADRELEAVYGDVRFERNGKTVRYVSGSYFRPWMFRLATFPPHPSFYIRRDCFERWGLFDQSYRISGDFDLLVRFMYLRHMRTRYLPLCTVAMGCGGVSTTLSRHSEMELEDLRSLRSHGIFTFRALTWLRYPLKFVELLRR